MRFVGLVESVVSEIFSRKFPEVIIVHHDDADGVTAAYEVLLAISKALPEANIKRVCLEKLFPQVIPKIHECSGCLVVYVDLGSPHISRISSCDGGRNTVLILDHHDPDIPAPKPFENVYQVNPEVVGLSGEEDASTSIVAYYFARKFLPPEKLAPAALIGAAELPLESFEKSYLIRQIIDEGSSAGVVRKSVRGCLVKLGNVFDLNITLSAQVTLMSSIGYYLGGVEKALEMLEHGVTDDIRVFCEKVRALRDRRFRQALMIVRHGLKQMKYIQWFHVGDAFRDMGVKSIGLFTSYLKYRYRSLINESKYLVGFMNMRRDIPGLGMLDVNLVKFSMRVPNELEKKVKGGEYPPLSEIVKLAEEFGGIGDGHSVAASGVIVKGREKEFVEKVDDYIETKVKGSSLARNS